jgi:DNA repair protein RadD
MPPMKLRHYQQSAVDGLFNFFKTNKTGNPLIICPTASGKSVIQAAFIRLAFSFPGQKWILLSHVMELIEQNHARLLSYWPDAQAGIYCAALKRKDFTYPITVASIQSIYKVAHHFGHVDGIIIDECHLVGDSQSGMYRQFIESLQNYNPRLRVIGMTATAFRLKTGMLTEGKDRLFTDVAYEIPITTLLKEGWIVPLLSKCSPSVKIDLSKIKLKAGDFDQVQMENAFDQDAITRKVLDEVGIQGADRKSWLFFASGIHHAMHLRDELRKRGITAEVISKDTPTAERAQILADYKQYKIRAVLNYATLTTGFDAPNIDLIVVLRGTKSAGLWMQILGRGLRLLGLTLNDSIENGKPNCKVLDDGGNLDRFGPINLISAKPQAESFSKEGNGGGISKAPTKQCPICHETQLIYNANCLDCGHKFPLFQAKHGVIAATGDFIDIGGSPEMAVETLKINSVTYCIHHSKAGNDTLKATYVSGINVIHEYISFDSVAAARRSMIWWKSRATNFHDSPNSTHEAFDRINELKTPLEIAVRKEGKKYEVIGALSFLEAIA